MGNDFLQSSPSHPLLDPLIYNPFPEMNTTQSSDLNHQHINQNHQHNSNNNQPHISNQQPIISGWTPIIQRTFNNQSADQFILYNSSPKFLNPNLSTTELEFDLSSNNLSLTPFLNHQYNNNLNNNITPQVPSVTNITPFHDKSLQLNDFFMDSPIRQTPLKDTPSKFRGQDFLQPITNPSNITSNPNLSLISGGSSGGSSSTPNISQNKRSITQIDTPPRQPNKMLHQKFLKSPIKSNISSFNFQTPSKPVLTNITNINNSGNVNLNKTPLRKEQFLKDFETPAKPTSNSSPSTIVMSSAQKSIRKENIKKIVEDDDNLTDTENSDENKAPVSPTPIKENNTLPCKTIINGDDSKPAMGIFSGKKIETKKNVPKMSAGMNRFQIVFTDVQSLMNNKKGKKNVKKLNRSQSVAPKKNSNLNVGTSSSTNNMGTGSSMEKVRNLERSVSLPITQESIQRQMINHKMNQKMNQKVGSVDKQTPVNKLMQNNKKEELSTGITPIMKSTLSLHGNSQTPLGKEPYQIQQMQDFLTPESKSLMDRMFEKSPFGMNQSMMMYGAGAGGGGISGGTPPQFFNQRLNLKLQLQHYQNLQMGNFNQSPVVNRYYNEAPYPVSYYPQGVRPGQIPGQVSGIHQSQQIHQPQQMQQAQQMVPTHMVGQSSFEQYFNIPIMDTYITPETRIRDGRTGKEN